MLHPDLLDAQLRVIARAARGADVRVLLPFVSGPGEVEHVRARSGGAIAVGAMIETPGAVDQIDAIAAADFVCIGTNDLFASMTGVDRAAGAPLLDARLLRGIERVVTGAHARQRTVTVCGELAGDPQGARILVGLGVDAISVATWRLAKVKLALREVTLDDCRSVAQKALA
jgi:phosphoenolpyruvate-protein kinase (PTS system EI component)